MNQIPFPYTCGSCLDVVLARAIDVTLCSLERSSIGGASITVLYGSVVWLVPNY